VAVVHVGIPGHAASQLAGSLQSLESYKKSEVALLRREFWGQVQPKQRIVGAIVAVNMLIFLAMQRTSLQGFMVGSPLYDHC